MPKYLFECPKCKRQYSRYKRVEQRDAPEYCDHTVTIGGGVKHFPHKMNRIFSASFQIIGSRQADSPDNDLYRIITNNSTLLERPAVQLLGTERVSGLNDKTLVKLLIPTPLPTHFCPNFVLAPMRRLQRQACVSTSSLEASA